MSITTCPTPQQLTSLVNGELSAHETDEAAEHISGCNRCQAAMESAVSAVAVQTEGGEIEVKIGELLTGSDAPPSDSALWKAIRSMAGDTPAPQEDTKVTPESSLRPTIETPSAGEPSAAYPFLNPSDDPAYIGKLHHFEIARAIGRGGMGIVFEAFDTHLRRTVAIKVLNPEYSKNEIARQRFCREGRAAAAIAHEHVVGMHQVAKDDDSEAAFLVMQYIEGETLEARMQKGRLSPREAARIGMQVAAGLAAAHHQDMVHRDIKPANILIEGSTDRVKLTDFGLARATDDVRLTKTGMVTGTPLYMSPEQAMGEQADERSDLFALGAVLYEMLIGESPFEAPSVVGVMKRIMDESPEAPSKLNPSIPPALSELTLALLAKKPENRPDSASIVAEALAEILTDFGPISPLQVPSFNLPAKKKTSRSRTRARRRFVAQNTIRLAWAVGIIGVASLIGTMSFMLLRSDETEANVAQGVSIPSVMLSGNSGTVWAVDFAPTGDRVATAIEDGTVRLWDISQQTIIKSFNAHRGIVWMVKYHPTRPLVATSGDDGMVKLWQSGTFELVREWEAKASVRKFAFSPDGTRIVAGDRDGVLHVWDIESEKELVTATQEGSIFGVDWSGDGQLIASVGSDKVVRVWDAETLDPRQSMRGHKGPIYNVAFAPEGPGLATVGWGKAIHLWNVETGEEERVLDGSESDNWSVAYCTDGGHLVAVSQDGGCHIWDLTNGELAASLRGHESSVHNVSLDAERYRIATSGRDGMVRVWDLSELAKSEQHAKK